MNARMHLRAARPLAFLVFAGLLVSQAQAFPTGPVRQSAVLTQAAPLVIPSAIQVPAGNELELSLKGVGVQIYDCTASATAPSGYAWKFRAPEATLFDNEGEVVGRHYAGPTWESTVDGSKVKGARLANEASLDGPKNIDWLLLSATVQAPGNMFGKVTYIQRISTQGGTAPSDGCGAGTLGAELRVPYKANYLFYQHN